MEIEDDEAEVEKGQVAERDTSLSYVKIRVSAQRVPAFLLYLLLAW
jgi:hypothetical protein